MAEYIKKDDAFDVACEECEAGTFYDIPSKIMALPSADVVPRKDYESMKRTVDKLNKALAERKRGMWQIVEKHTEYRTERCSICGFVANRTYIRDIWNFCPNCGANMRGGNDG